MIRTKYFSLGRVLGALTLILIPACILDWDSLRPRPGARSSPDDFDGDGLADVLIGAPDVQDGDTPGAAYLLVGSAAGLVASDITLRCGGGASTCGFGTAASFGGDLNRNGFPDAIIGAGQTETHGGPSRGEVLIFAGGPNGLDETFESIASPQVSDFALFGTSATTMPSPSPSDAPVLVAGAPLQDLAAERGAVFVYRDGLTTANAIELTQGAEPRARYGAALASGGDIDGDGWTDLLVGAPAREGGAAFVWWGSSDGFDSGPTRLDAPSGIEDFGGTLASGDVNGDGLSDVVVGTRDECATSSASPAAVVVVPGGDRDLAQPLRVSLADTRARTFVAVYDLDVNGRAEILVGTNPAEGSGAVSVYAWRDALERVAEIRGPANSPRFGASLWTPGDIDGDGLPDVVVGVPNETAGAVVVCFGGSTLEELCARQQQVESPGSGRFADVARVCR